MKTQNANPPIGGTAKAFTLVELVFVLAILALFVFATLPAVHRPHHSHHLNCVNNLKQLGLAIKTWSLDNNDQFPMNVSVTNGGAMELIERGLVFPHFQVMSNELSTPRILVCPEDKRRSAATNFTTDFMDSKLSYFVGVDASDTAPQMVLSGDRNLCIGRRSLRGLVSLTTNQVVQWDSQIHNRRGNLLLADGSVQQMTQNRLSAALCSLGMQTNRLIIP